MVSASAGFVALHTTKGGEQEVRLPGVYDVVDLRSGEVVYKQSDTIRMDVAAPARRMFALRPYAAR